MQESNKIPSELTDIFGIRCSGQRAGERKSLTIGFGEKIPHPTLRRPEAVRSEWELRTYRAAWRLCRDGILIVGSRDLVDSDLELDEKLKALDAQCIRSIEVMEKFDVRVTLDRGFTVDFFWVASDDEEILTVSNVVTRLYVTYAGTAGWVVGEYT